MLRSTIRRSGHDGEPQQHRGDQDQRRQHENRSIGKGWHPVILGEELDDIGDDLRAAKRTETVRSEPVLPETEQSTFPPDQQPGCDHGAEEHRQDQQVFVHLHPTPAR